MRSPLAITLVLALSPVAPGCGTAGSAPPDATLDARSALPDAVSPEIAEDLAYLEKIRAEFQSVGISADAELAYGDPADQIIKWVEKKRCDLVAMSTHGHRFLADLFLGSTATKVRHNIAVPILFLCAK